MCPRRQGGRAAGGVTNAMGEGHHRDPSPGGGAGTQDLDSSPPDSVGAGVPNSEFNTTPRRKPSAAPMRRPAAAVGRGGGRRSDSVSAGVSSSQLHRGPCVDIGPETEFERCAARISGEPYKVPSDGLCLYHCVAAAVLGPAVWGSLSLEAKIRIAHNIKKSIIAEARGCGDDRTANRLEGGDRPENYPDVKDLPYFVKYIGGAIHVYDEEDHTPDHEFRTEEGDGDPMFIVWHCSTYNGAGEECRQHFDIYQSYVRIKDATAVPDSARRRHSGGGREPRVPPTTKRGLAENLGLGAPRFPVAAAPAGGDAAADVGAPPARPAADDVLNIVQSLEEDVAKQYPTHVGDKRKLLRVMKYLCDTTLSSYQMSHVQRLVILLILDGEHWRTHKKHTFHYADGSWDQTEYLDIVPWDMLTALEGLLVTLGTWQGDGDPPENWSPPEWTWAAIRPHLHGYLSRDDSSVQSLCAVAKEHSDALRVATDNKVCGGGEKRHHRHQRPRCLPWPGLWGSVSSGRRGPHHTGRPPPSLAPRPGGPGGGGVASPCS